MYQRRDCLCDYAPEGTGSDEHTGNDVYEPDAAQKENAFQTEAEKRGGEKDPVGSKIRAHGPEPHDRGRSAPLYPKMQYGQRHVHDGDSTDGTKHDQNIALYQIGIFAIVKPDMR